MPIERQSGVHVTIDLFQCALGMFLVAVLFLTKNGATWATTRSCLIRLNTSWSHQLFVVANAWTSIFFTPRQRNTFWASVCTDIRNGRCRYLE